ncbi:MAG: calcium/sodium antiporter [Bacteroidales bacterium]
MTLILYTVLSLLAFYLIAQVSDRFFIPSLDAISDRLGIRSDVAGATFMAMGSSAPELFIALIAVLHPGGHAEIGMGTIVGSALFNVLAIIGGVALVRKAVVSWQPILRDTSFYLISIALLAFVFYNDEIHLFEAILLMAVYILYVFAVIYWSRFFPYKDDAVYVEPTEKEPKVKHYKLLRTLIKPLDQLLKLTFLKEKYFIANFSISIIWIALLSWLLVNSAIKISAILNVPEGIIALTVLAIGTSIPDMITSLIVAKKGRGGMAISNALGSNVFDILLGLGLPWFIVILLTGESVEVFSKNIFLSVILLFSSVMVFFLLLMMRRWQIRKPTGLFLLALYLAYLIWQIVSIL